MTLSDFQSQRPKFNIKMGQYGNNKVNMIESKLMSAFLSNFAHVANDERINPIDF